MSGDTKVILAVAGRSGRWSSRSVGRDLASRCRVCMVFLILLSQKELIEEREEIQKPYTPYTPCSGAPSALRAVPVALGSDPPGKRRNCQRDYQTTPQLKPRQTPLAIARRPTVPSAVSDGVGVTGLVVARLDTRPHIPLATR